MRQSIASNRMSTAHGGSMNPQAASAAAMAKLIEKKKEFDAVSALERASALYLERIQGLADDCDIMANAGEIHGQVLSQWPKMFQILNLFLTSQINTEEEATTELGSTEGQKLVRIPIDELQAASATSKQKSES
ncbi:hypothetical protein BDN72DRAFT_833107 [Pluteus cervinus]|uniref:Uncharacterized protein n=1 Tax=Pluteus cervinus TaxID=181527 RepID=A0ACD3BAK6_9AGAR|nr:hypothetical protein BDN72DRAFT_833107 [Pluteus cervinus]